MCTCLECREKREKDLLAGQLKKDMTFQPPNPCRVVDDVDPSIPWDDPEDRDLMNDDFLAIWEAIKTWDINVPEAYKGYCGATGNHCIHIMQALGLKTTKERKGMSNTNFNPEYDLTIVDKIPVKESN